MQRQSLREIQEQTDRDRVQEVQGDTDYQDTEEIIVAWAV